MTIQSLTEQIRNKASFLCVGLDSDLSKLPAAVRNHPEAQFAFNKAIIEATHDLAVAYKINTAFYESDGSKGIKPLKKPYNIWIKTIQTILPLQMPSEGILAIPQPSMHVLFLKSSPLTP
jgi:orotidine-5'-phosphate decarboxylase